MDACFVDPSLGKLQRRHQPAIDRFKWHFLFIQRGVGGTARHGTARRTAQRTACISVSSSSLTMEVKISHLRRWRASIREQYAKN